MHVIWQWVHPMRLMVAMYVFLGILAFTIHFILLSTERYNWLAGPPTKKADVHVPTAPVGNLPVYRFG